MKYKINEIFYSIQGEGRWTGTPCVFIRFSGCNLNCSFCDTNHNNYSEMFIEEIIEQIELYKSNHTVLTGGEPLLQVNIDLLKELKKYKKVIHIETNGTIELHGYMRMYIDWITVSPKPNTKLPLTEADELKIVWNTEINLLQYRQGTNCKYYYIQPCDINGKTNINEVIKIIKDNPEWSLSSQLHKLIGIK